MRFVITEEEKNRIRSLYESVPPDEWEIVDWINPFRDTKYLPYAPINYSKELKDGDLFYNLGGIYIDSSEQRNDDLKNECLDNFRNKIKPDFSDLVGKTIRLKDDSIVKIKKIHFFMGHGDRGYHTLRLNVIKTPDDRIPTDFSIVYEENVPYFREQDIPTTLLDKITSKLPNITAKDLPDCIFSLKKIKRKKTDFLP